MLEIKRTHSIFTFALIILLGSILVGYFQNKVSASKSSSEVDASTQGARNAYIPLGAVNQIAEIDPETLSISRIIEQDDNPHGLGITPDGNYLYAASMFEKEATDRTKMAAPPGVSEEDHAAHHGESTASTNQEIPKTYSFISLINAQTGQVEKRIDVERFTHHIVISPDGSKVIGVQSGANRIVVIDTATNQVERYLSVGKTPNFAVISNDGAKIFVSSAGTGAILVINPKTWQIVTEIPVGKRPEHMTFGPKEKYLYVINVASGGFSIIDLATLTVIKQVATGDSPHGIAVDEQTNSVIVANKTDNNISIFDLSSQRLQTIPLNPLPYHVANSPDGKSVWITSRAERKMWVLSPNPWSIKQTLELPGIGHQIAMSPKRN